MNYPTIFSITEDEIDINQLVAQITLTTTGAAAIFTGMVRGITSCDSPHETIYLEYEAYVPMAEAKMKQVADEIRETLGYHRRHCHHPTHRETVPAHADCADRLHICAS
ncbi:MAG: molybdenum cofactor biosynthesis protein MoaE [Anaerolineales bacterium]